MGPRGGVLGTPYIPLHGGSREHAFGGLPNPAAWETKERGKPRIMAAQRIPLRLKGALLMLALAAAGCSFLGQQMAASAVDLCIEKNCSNQEGMARHGCDAECQRQYNR